MPMGTLNAALIFVAMITKIQMEWYKIFKESGLKNVASSFIVHNELLYGAQPGSF